MDAIALFTLADTAAIQLDTDGWAIMKNAVPFEHHAFEVPEELMPKINVAERTSPRL